MISYSDIVYLSESPSSGVLIRTKCFICKRDIVDEKVIQLAQLKLDKHINDQQYYYDFFKNGLNAKIILIHISCFQVSAGDEFLFDES